VRLSETDISSVIALLRAVSATEIMPRFRHLRAEDVRTKSGPQDPVTVADEAAERALTFGLKKLFPDADVIGEESVSARPELLGRLRAPGPVWVVDPIDGTANYTSELPLFGVMLALVEADTVLAGFIHDPVGDDTAFAVPGGGAWLVAPDNSRRRLHVAAPAPVEEMTGSISWRYLPADLRARVMSRLDRLAAVTDYRCAAHQYRMMAAGHCHMQMFRKLLPWDHAAGFLLHREAGGYARRFDGSEYVPSETDGGLLLAPDVESWRALHEALLEM
jgi:fructose-1,6-bisphosphatase/inositol monophosphatase family enzyme